MSGATKKQAKPTQIKEPSLDNSIYKVKLYDNGAISTIFVFSGNKTAENNKGLLDTVFPDKNELKNTRGEKIKVKLCEQQIHFDDSISTIKLKILKELQRSSRLTNCIYIVRKLRY